MALQTIADAKIYIGPQKDDQAADFVAADFDTIDEADWVLIDGWITMGAWGDEQALIEQALINRGRDAGQKGTYNAPAMDNVFAFIPDDPGQIAFTAASKTKDNYAFRIVDQAGDAVAFVGLAMASQRQGGDANTIDQISMGIKPNSNFVAIA